MGRRVIIVVRSGVDTIDIGGVSYFSALCEKPEILQDVVLGMGPDPAPWKGSQHNGQTCQASSDLPNVVVYGLHHTLLGLFYGNIEPFGLAVACHRGGSMAYGAVGVHPNSGLACPRSAWRARSAVSGIHLSRMLH